MAVRLSTLDFGNIVVISARVNPIKNRIHLILLSGVVALVSKIYSPFGRFQDLRESKTA